MSNEAAEMLLNQQHRIHRALEIASMYGQSDGSHHKAWVIDQMVRELSSSPEAYEQWITDYSICEDGCETYEWDEGIAP